MLSAKDLVIDFVNFIFAIIIAGLVALYFIAGDNFENFKRILESLAPFGVLALLFAIMLKLWREKSKKREREGNFGLTIDLTFFDKLKCDIVVLLLPAAVCLAAFVLKGRVSPADMVQAGAVLGIAWLWERWLFKKAK